MEEEQYYGNHTNHSEDQRYSNFADPSYKNSTTYGGGHRGEARNGDVANRQRRTHDSGVKLKRCPSFFLGKPLADFDCSDEHQVKHIAMYHSQIGFIRDLIPVLMVCHDLSS